LRSLGQLQGETENPGVCLFTLCKSLASNWFGVAQKHIILSGFKRHIYAAHSTLHRGLPLSLSQYGTISERVWMVQHVGPRFTKTYGLDGRCTMGMSFCRHPINADN
jgi:hypothetical protein